jgi:hypothetical protein
MNEGRRGQVKYAMAHYLLEEVGSDMLETSVP